MSLAELRIEHSTLSNKAYLALRSAIVGRKIQSGDKLLVRSLVAELGLSPTPIKLALAALSHEGLVVAEPHRGYYVPRIDLADVEELYALREMLDGLAARLAAKKPTVDSIDQIKHLLAGQKTYVEAGDSERYGDLDLAFHRAIREASGNTRLVRVAEAFDGQIRLFISTSAKVPGRLRASLREHTAIVKVITRKDPMAAERAMRHHVRQAGIALREYMRKRDG